MSLRDLPSVDRLAAQLDAPHALAVRAAREAISDRRRELTSGKANGSVDLVDRARQRLHRIQQSLRPVHNATGVIIHTNLGRAPLAVAAQQAVERIAAGYSSLETDLASGTRGSRQAHVDQVLCELTGAGAALVVNNGAGAALLAVAALAGRDGSVVVSRGQLVEIGGGFRIPEVVAQTGARLVEVGTTNRTRASDYAAAITPETVLLLAVHPSNFRVIGFTESPPLAELARLAHGRDLLLMHDLGSGALLATEQYGMEHEPTPAESLAAGCDVVCFSGDKLLGGPQAGIIVGRAAILARIARHPLMRAIRSDKLTLAALEATLRAYRDGTQLRTIPTLRMIATPLPELRTRAGHWAETVRGWGYAARTRDGESAVGGGTLPGETLHTVLCAIEAEQTQQESLDVAVLATRLRTGEPPVIGRVLRDALLLDPRTVAPEDDGLLLRALAVALRVA